MDKKNKTSIHMIAEVDSDIKGIYDKYMDGEMPILATRNMVLFPGVMSPILVGKIGRAHV